LKKGVKCLKRFPYFLTDKLKMNKQATILALSRNKLQLIQSNLIPQGRIKGNKSKEKFEGEYAIVSWMHLFKTVLN